MDYETHELVMTGLRTVAEKLEQVEGNTSFPGWDMAVPKNQQERLHGIRNAALAVLNTTNPDDGIRATYKDIGRLVRYLADMME